jgi:hypothetical protein
MKSPASESPQKKHYHDPYKEYLKNNEVVLAFKKLSETKKGRTDHTKPKSVRLSRLLSARKARKNVNDRNEHQLNVDNMLRRIDDIGSI